MSVAVVYSIYKYYVEDGPLFWGLFKIHNVSKTGSISETLYILNISQTIANVQHNIRVTSYGVE
jgi:hypothetical protein